MASAKFKLTAFTGGVFAVVLTVIAAVSYFNFNVSSVKNYKDKLDSQAFLASMAIEQKVLSFYRVLSNMTTSIPVDANGVQHHDQLLKQLLDFQNKFSVINTFVGLKDGRTFTTSHKGIIDNFNAKAQAREWYVRGFMAKNTSLLNHSNRRVAASS